ncbi:MAG TPA: STAS domain-containing protein [Thermoanaerobaculaceae bacterium]|nr:STAS domain-containing protein [Thermoanaerobaculaceae bacterium]
MATRAERLLELNERDERGWSVLALKGRLDSVTVGRFTERCAAWIDAGRANVVLDLSDLDYVSSAGLSSILGAAKRAQERHARLVVTGLKGLVKEVFAISGFEAVLSIYPDIESAIAAS